MLVLALDFETTGLDRNSDRITEVGAVLYSTTQARCLLSSAYMVDNQVAVSKEITAMTGISKGMIDKFGLASKIALTALLGMIEMSEAIAGQNFVEFDMPFLENWCAREGETLPPRLLIDTKTDLPGIDPKHLGYMAADAGFLNPFPHSALSDCLTVLKLISLHDGKRYPTTFDDIVARASSPRVYIKAHVSFDNNKLAKKRKYAWRPEERLWFKCIKEMDLEQEIKDAPFDISRIAAIPMH